MSIQSIGSVNQVNSYKKNPAFGNFTTSITKENAPKKASQEVLKVVEGLKKSFAHNEITDVNAGMLGDELIVSAGPGLELRSNMLPSVTFETKIFTTPLDKLEKRGASVMKAVQQHDADLYQRHQWGA